MNYLEEYEKIESRAAASVCGEAMKMAWRTLPLSAEEVNELFSTDAGIFEVIRRMGEEIQKKDTELFNAAKNMAAAIRSAESIIEMLKED